ncbi:MAG: autotransporter domain-containing protein [Parachlamydiaceae bacterium]|nr:autotransporter domain-containing protein [Parachlamydiaceae bacterium]
MKKFCLVLVTVFSSLSPTLFAAVQQVSGPTATLNATDGVPDGVNFQGLQVPETTLTVPNGFNVNTNNNVNGITTDTGNRGNVVFSGNSTVFGGVGQLGARVIDGITGGADGATVTFNGVVSVGTNAFTLSGNGTMQFNNTANGALTFSNDGTLVIGTGATFNGAINNLAANTGTLTLNSASTVNGAVGAAVGPLKTVNVVGGNATVVGSLSATNFFLGTNTLQNNGALALPVNTTLNTTLISNSVFGHINTLDDQIAAPVVTVNVDATQALLTPGEPLFIVDAASGTSGRTVLVTSNSARYTFVGFNLNGDIVIVPTLVPGGVTNPIASAVGSILNALLPIAAANPGSDLAFVQLQLNSLTTAAQLQDALLQIAPASGLIGIGRESFNTTKQFQKMWLEHLYRNRCQRQITCCTPCEPCCDPCNSCCQCCTEEGGLRIWGDGFGYYGHQDDKGDLNGYKVNTWGTMLAVETPILCGGLQAGLAAGYAYTDLDQRKFGNSTNIHNYVGTVYFSYNPSAWFLDGGFSYGWNRYDGERHINFAEIHRTAHAKYNGKEYTGFLATGYQFHYNCLDITPMGSLLYSHLHLDSYTEKGANSLNLRIGKQRYKYLESSLGLKAEYLYQTCYGVFIPEVHSFWLHDFYTKGLDADASFTGIGAAAGSFENLGPRFDKNTWNIGGSISYVFNDRLSMFALYDYERSKTYFNHQWTVEMSYDF